jgi:DNA-binding NtrC family response regulator
MRRVTEALRIPRKTLYDKMARHGIQPAQHRRKAAGDREFPQ